MTGAITKATTAQQTQPVTAAWPECARYGGGPDDRRGQHRADPDRVDVIEMRALELDAGGAQPSGLLIMRSATSAPTQATATIE